VWPWRTICFLINKTCAGRQGSDRGSGSGTSGLGLTSPCQVQVLESIDFLNHQLSGSLGFVLMLVRRATAPSKHFCPERSRTVAPGELSRHGGGVRNEEGRKHFPFGVHSVTDHRVTLQLACCILLCLVGMNLETEK
jgi:hypothetical protein